MERWRTCQASRINRGGVPVPILALLCGLLPCCDRSSSSSDAARSAMESPLRDVRVKIISDAEKLRLRAKHSITAEAEDGSRLTTWPRGRWLEVRAEPTGGIQIGDRVLAIDRIMLSVDECGVLQLAESVNDDWQDACRYPGRLHVSISDGGRIDVINYVDVEEYVGPVVAAEVWPTFETEALRAQAIAVRTFVLYETQQRRGGAYDVAATQGSQVYRGLRDDAIGRRSQKAAQYTRGIVCTWNDGTGDRLFPTYYSSACGGMTQSAAIFGQASDIAPLAGGVTCDYCRIAPGDTYRWGPLQIPADEVFQKLVARNPELSSLERLKEVDAAMTTPSGRIIQVRLTGSSGETRDILAERFRVTIGPDLMKSTDCEIRLMDGEVVLSRGRGYGHGLGLCQWGMQGQALEGRRAGEILRYYYPGAELTRVY